MTRFFLVAPLLLGACQMDGMSSQGVPRMDQEGTCFLYVMDEGNERYTLVSGVGDGTTTPKAMMKKGLTASTLDTRWARERKTMDINPECLAILATDRAQARPAPQPKAPTKTN
jgi:hypothetical protein